MAAPKLTRVRCLAAKEEVTTGTPESLTGAEGVFNAFDTIIQKTTEYVPRPGQGSLTPIKGSYGGLMGTATFSTHIYGGAATPAWMSTFLPACGLGESTGVFTPSSIPPEGGSATAHTLTIGCYMNGIRKALRGAMGNVVFTFTAGRPVVAAFDFRGVWIAPTDTAILTPTYPTTAPLRAVSGGLTIGSFTPKWASATLNLNNEVYLREDGNAAEGFHSAVVSGRRVTFTIDVEATPLSDFDPHDDLIDRTTRAIGFGFGGTGNAIDIAMPDAQVVSVNEVDRNGVTYWTVEYEGTADAAAGNDELSITRS